MERSGKTQRHPVFNCELSTWPERLEEAEGQQWTLDNPEDTENRHCEELDKPAGFLAVPLLNLVFCFLFFLGGQGGVTKDPSSSD